MVDFSTAVPGSKPLRILSFESRRSGEMARLIEAKGGAAFVAPSMQEVPLGSNQEATAMAKRLLQGDLHAVIFLTGSGADALIQALESTIPRDRLFDALSKSFLVARGPKTMAALTAHGYQPHPVPEPATWKEILLALDDQKTFKLRGSLVAIQETGQPIDELARGLASRGARILRVPIYRWSLPNDTTPLRQALHTIIGGLADIVLFTNAHQIQQVVRFAQEEGLEDEFRGALAKTVVASVGPICTEYLDEYGVPVDVQPELPRMADLVAEASAKGPALLKRKRGEGRGARGEGTEERDKSANSESLRRTFSASTSPLSFPPAPLSPPPSPLPPPPSPLSPPPSPLTPPPSPVAPHSSRYPLLAASPFLKACRRETTPFTPIWLMRQAGRYMKEYRDLRDRHSFLDLCKDSDLATEVTVYAVERLGVDAAIIFSDLLVILEPMGLVLEYAKGDGPVIRNPVRQAADVARLAAVRGGEGLEFVYDAIRKTRQNLPSHIPLIGFAGAPFTLASYMIEGKGSRNFIGTKAMMYTDSDAWKRLMSKITQSLIGYVNAQINAGAQAIQIFDSWVGCLSPEDYRAYVLPFSRALMEGIHAGTPVIHFGTETAMLLELMKEAGGSVMGIDWRVELDAAWARLGDVAIQGNMDPTVLFAGLPEIRRQAKRILDQAANRPGHIFNLGHGVLPNTPVGHVKALVDMVHELSSRTLKPAAEGL